MLNEFRDYLKGDKLAESSFFKFESFKDTLKKDTLWLPLIARLNQRLHKEHIIKNIFSKDMHVSMFTYNQYAEYFEEKSINDSWIEFHEDFPGHSILTDLSEIVSDDKRAVFYFSWRCGGSCGDGSLILFYKAKSGWKYVCSIPMWNI